jgi:hypothetical protein
MRFQLKNEILTSYSCSCISLIEDLLIPNCHKNYWALIRTIGPSNYWTATFYQHWYLKTIHETVYRAPVGKIINFLFGFRTVGPSDYRTFGLLDRHHPNTYLWSMRDKKKVMCMIKAKWIQTKFGIYICFFQKVSIKSILLMRFQLKNEILTSYSCSCISLIEDLIVLMLNSLNAPMPHRPTVQ